MTLQSLIKKHKFDYVNSDITDTLFPVPERLPTKDTEYKVFNFNKHISSEEAIKEMEKEGYLPANIYELLSFKWNEKDWVVSLDSVGKVFGCRYVPCLGRYDSRRSLCLSWWGDGWVALYRFLGVRNLSLMTTQPIAGQGKKEAKTQTNTHWKKIFDEWNDIECESIEHLTTILYCFLGEDYKDVKQRDSAYKKSIEYIKEWVMYRSQFTRNLYNHLTKN